MDQSGSKLDKLGDILGIDDTEDLPRPEPRRGVGEVLAGKAPAGTLPGPKPPARAPHTPAPQPSGPDDASLAERSAALRSGAARPERRPSGNTPMSRSTSTVPVQVMARLEAARRHRWTVSRMLSSAMSSPMPSIEQAEEMLARIDESPRAVCSYRLPVTDMDALDALADEWRLSRSQLIGLLLDLELARQGF